jgi:uncharacterized protein YkwD
VKKALLTILVALLTLGAPLAQGEGPLDETRFTLRQELLRLINRDRKQFGLSVVELDASVSTFADEYCRQQIKEGTSGHFNLEGLPPYMRYSFAGGNDGVSENAAAWSASYSFGARALYEMAKRSQEAMMNEVAPNDGHRKTILDPYATHVGIGLAWERGEFRIVQEFVRRYVTWSKPIVRTATVADRVNGAAKPVAGYTVEGITVHHEALPLPISARVANKIESYRLPEKRREYLPRVPQTYRRFVGAGIEEVSARYPNGSKGDFARAEDGSFAFHVPFNDGPGIYTVVVWVRKDGDTESIAASNVSIRVDEVAQVSYSSQ